MFLFLVLFKPFGLENNPNYIMFSAYLISCATFAGLLTTVIIPLAFPRYFNEEKWTLKRNLIWVIGINFIFATVMFLAINSYFIYKFNSFNDFTLKKYLYWAYLQILIGVPLGTIINLINQYYLLKKHLKIADGINQSIEKEYPDQTLTGLENNEQKSSTPIESVSLEFEIEKYKKVRFDIEDIVYVEALGNYVNIVYNNNGHKKITIRETINNFEHKIGASELIYKPHRSYLVNLQNIENIIGDSQGLKIHLKNCDKTIPVSRNKIKEFRKLVTAIL
jgi:hypothetical protein